MSEQNTPLDTPHSERTDQQDITSAEKQLSALIEKRSNLQKHLV
jgi:ribosomal protein S15P/S13E